MASLIRYTKDSPGGVCFLWMLLVTHKLFFQLFIPFFSAGLSQWQVWSAMPEIHINHSRGGVCFLWMLLVLSIIHLFFPAGLSQWQDASAAPEKRIVNGEEITIKDADWNFLVHVELTSSQGGAYTCGGTVINENYVLTAAHCIIW